MSGGRFEHRDISLKNEIFGWCCEKWSNVFEDREISELVWDLLDLIHTFDYYICDDIGEEQYLEEKKKFKNKWLDNRGVRVKRIVDESIQNLKEELYRTYGISQPPLG